MQTRSSDENSLRLSVRLSVCLSVKRVDRDKTEDKSVQIFMPYERAFSLVFWVEMVDRGSPFYWKFRVNRPPFELNRRFWPIITSSASAVAVSEKEVQLTLIGSPLSAFQ